MQAHLIFLVEILALRTFGVEAAVQIEKISVVLVGGAKTMNHQLCQGHRFVGFFADVLPAGKRAGAALGGLETMEINLIWIKARQAFGFQQITGRLMGGVLQTGAVLHDGIGDSLQRRFVCRVWQRTWLGGVHAFSILEK
nr:MULTISPECIES: hypothetical protein [unclassified Pseudomonas]